MALRPSQLRLSNNEGTEGGTARWSQGTCGLARAAAGGMGSMGPRQQQRMQRHWTYMNEGVPTAYRGARSRVRATPEVICEGRKLYMDNRASCHGSDGRGDGDAGRSLEPSPAFLRSFIQMPMSGDKYLLWAISEGGKRFETAMPAFKESLSEDNIWKIIAYMRAGIP